VKNKVKKAKKEGVDPGEFGKDEIKDVVKKIMKKLKKDNDEL
jgi:hypothetical protein